jgi:sulfofructose kinase
MARVLCVGLATQDFIFSVDELPSRPEKTRARAMVAAGGGLAATAAVAVARLGGEVTLATRLGDDFIGDQIVSELMGEGVDCALVQRFPGTTSSVSAVLVLPDGERLVVNHGDDAIPDDPTWLPAKLPDKIAAVHGDTRWEAGALHMFAAARGKGVPAVLDVERAPEREELLGAATHAVFSAQGLREYLRQSDIPAAVASLAKRHGTFIAVTDGAQGTFFAGPSGQGHVPSFPVRAVDTLGAGDTFHGALTLGLGEGMDEVTALRFASAAAALKCTRFGGRAGIPSRAETDEFLRRHG